MPGRFGRCMGSRRQGGGGGVALWGGSVGWLCGVALWGGLRIDGAGAGHGQGAGSHAG